MKVNQKSKVINETCDLCYCDILPGESVALEDKKTSTTYIICRKCAAELQDAEEIGIYDWRLR